MYSALSQCAWTSPFSREERKALRGSVSRSAGSRSGGRDQGFPLQPESVHFPSEAPQTGDPPSLPEPQGHGDVGQGTPSQSPEQLALAPPAPGSLQVFVAPSLLTYGRTSKGTFRIPIPRPPPQAFCSRRSGEGPGICISTEHPGGPEPCGLVVLVFFIFLFFTWIKAQSCVRRALYLMALFIVGLYQAILFTVPLVPFPPFSGILPMVNTDPLHVRESVKYVTCVCSFT